MSADYAYDVHNQARLPLFCFEKLGNGINYFGKRLRSYVNTLNLLFRFELMFVLTYEKRYCR